MSLLEGLLLTIALIVLGASLMVMALLWTGARLAKEDAEIQAAMARHPSARPWWWPSELEVRPPCDCGAETVPAGYVLFSADGFTHSAAGCIETTEGVL